MHQPVLLSEILAILHDAPDGWVLDATFGRGGHTKALLQKGKNIIACDVDPQAEQSAHQLSNEFGRDRFRFVRGNFAKLAKFMEDENIDQLAGALLDLGVSSPQLDEASYGLSFNKEAPLDMRLDPDLGVTAADLLKILSERQLTDLFYDFSQEREGKYIARAIVKAREQQPITTTTQLADLVIATKRERASHLHPATKVFMALRMAVNSELDVLSEVLEQLPRFIKLGGIVCVISFHEGEDRLVKQAFRRWSSTSAWDLITKKPLTPSQAELEENPRSRSAKLRVIRKDRV